MYGTLIDAGCLALLWRLTRREGLVLLDLVGFERTSLGRDALFGLALVPASLVFIFAGVYAVFQTILYLRVRRLIPFAIAHALMDGAGVLVGVLLPLLRE